MDGSLNLAPDVLNADRLINIDITDYGLLVYGCAGYLVHSFSKTYSRSTQTAAGMTKITFRMSGLRGGHSADYIGKNLSAMTVVTRIVEEIISQECLLVSLECGQYPNAIPTSCTLSFAAPDSSLAAIRSQIIGIMDEMKSDNPDENIVFDIESDAVSPADFIYPVETVSDMVALLENIPVGVIERDSTGRWVKTNNIGIVNLSNGEFFFQPMMRSDFNSYLAETKLQYVSLSQQLGFQLELEDEGAAWESDINNSFLQQVLKNYRQVCPQVKLYYELGALEISEFSRKRPQMNCVSVGPQISDCHSINEALHVNTVKPLLQVLAATLQE